MPVLLCKDVFRFAIYWKYPRPKSYYSSMDKLLGETVPPRPSPLHPPPCFPTSVISPDRAAVLEPNELGFFFFLPLFRPS